MASPRRVGRGALAFGPAVAIGGDPADAADMAKAKQLLAGGGEGPVRPGAQLCLEVGSAGAMELLVPVLEGEQPHDRDIVWEVIPKFTDSKWFQDQVEQIALSSGGRFVVRE